MRSMGTLLEADGRFRLYECFVDGTFSKAKGGGDGIGCAKAGKGAKIMILVDAKGLPLAVSTGSASPHESGLIQEIFGFMPSSALPERIIGDKAYDSDKLDAQMAGQGIERIAPNRANRPPSQAGRPLRRYKRRSTVERTIGWLQNYRRLCIRWEKSTPAFQGFLHLACSLRLMKEGWG
jgi:transposase